MIVQDKHIPALSEHEPYRYLGIPIGMMRKIDSLEKLVDDLCGDLDRIQSSLLSPWQKLDMIITFVQPCLTFALFAGEPLKSSLSNNRKKLIEVVRSILNLPQRATFHIIFESTKAGGLAFQDPLAEVDVQKVVQAIKMLSSSDLFMVSVARSELWKAVRFAAQADPSPALTRDFLSGSMAGNFHPYRIRYRTHSLWTRAHESCRRLNISFSVPDNDSLSISTEASGPRHAKAGCGFLHHLVQDRATTKLLEKPDQSKVARAMVADGIANGSSWMFNGLNMTFSDWLFIHHARLNAIPTNKNKSRWSVDVSPLANPVMKPSQTSFAIVKITW